MTIMANKRKVIVINEEDESEEQQESSEEEENESEEVDAEEEDVSEEGSSSSEDERIETATKITKAPIQESTENDADDDDSDSVGGEDDEMGDANINPAWADSIAKILKTNKPKKKKTLVLSKAKKLTDARKEKPKPAGFQVETEGGEVKEEQLDAKVADKDSEKVGEPPRRKKKDVLSVRKKPNILEKDRERKLAKIATKGVVQLFNAVKAQQKDIQTKLDEAGPLELRRDKALKTIDKRMFLDVLMGEKSQVAEKSDGVKRETEPEQRTTWNVLRDDFMMGAKMKDWDKELEGEEEMEVETNVESE